MAPLYKRYFPPKPNAAPLPPASALAPTSTHSEPLKTPTHQPEPSKRKRERSEDEVAERKAKKLRKKGDGPATHDRLSALKATENAVGGAKSVGLNEQAGQDGNNEPQGEFAHIKNAKKRHKLEKEARKQRKAAESENKKTQLNGSANNKEPGHYESTQRDGHPPTTSTSESLESTSHAPDDSNVDSTKRKKRRKHDHDTVTQEGKGTTEPTSNGVARRQEEKDTGATKPYEANHGEQEQSHAKQAPLEALNGASEQPQARKRRHKLESILQKPPGESQDQEVGDDDHLKKHGRILDKYQKSTKLSQFAPKSEAAQKEQPGPRPVVLDLAPLPQPEKAPVPGFKPDSSALPSWLANPMVVSGDTKSSFDTLQLEPKTVQYLSKLGFNDALPVQQALIPILLPPGVPGADYRPGTENILPDVAVGAPTGSGKTIAYLLPIIESIKKTAGIGNLTALIVVPTRELVLQVAAVAESLAKGSSVKVGMATGAGAFKDEQVKLVRHGRAYNPKRYRELIEKAHQRNYPPPQDSEEFEEYLDGLEKDDAKAEKRIQDAVSGLVDHIPTYDSAVDILVATPGRLLEHLSSTVGFGLAHLQWLVLDEADKLLDLQYDGFLETVNKELSRPRNDDEQDARERYLRSKGAWSERQERRVRKVVLSATMTKDLSKLVELKLKRPQMIIVRGTEQATEGATNGHSEIPTEGVKDIENGFELPPTLKEYCVPVGDGSEKPLYLVELLRARILNASEPFGPSSIPAGSLTNINGISGEAEADEDMRSDSEYSTDSDSSSSVSESEDSSDSESSEDESDSRHDSAERLDENEATMHPERTAMLDRISRPQTAPSTISTVLIFTSSTESANRLSHLLKALEPRWTTWVHTMTRADPKRKSISTAKSTDPIITISTDRAGRGLDAIGNRTITYVVQYDVPRSATGYVHRVGRTARAGKPGEAWTLFTHSEARWFLKDIARAKNIKRVEEVEKYKLSVDDDDLRERLRKAVDDMRSEILGHRS